MQKDDVISRQSVIDALKALEEHAPTAQHISAIYDCEDVVIALPPAQPTQTDTSNTLKALDCVERQAAIDTEGLDEQIRCEMCKNPMHTDRGCDGHCKYDEKLYERIMQILDERIKPLPSAQLIAFASPDTIQNEKPKFYPERWSEIL